VPDAANFPEIKHADPDYAIHDTLKKRFSPRAFADRPVEEAKIRQVLEAARWSASSYNEQPWRYLVATRERTAAYERMLSCLTEGNQAWAKHAPVLMLSFYRTHFSERGGGEPGSLNRCATHDVGAASANLTNQATALDLYVHQMAGIQITKIRDLYEVPEPFEPMAGLALGYLGDPDDLPEAFRKSERSERSRAPLPDFVFADTWGHTADFVVADDDEG
jgi:nitroreductase